MATNYNPSIVTSGLVLCLDAGNTRSYPGSGSVFTDLSGNNNNFTLNGGPYKNYGVGGSLVYSGSQTLTSSFTPSNTWSISMWFNNTSTYNIHNRGLFSTYGTSNFNGCYIGTTILASNALRIFYNSNSSSVINYSFLVNTWYQITVTSNGTNLTVYVNGTAVNTINTATTNADTLTIGQTRFDNNTWIGNIANTLVYNRALTVEEVAQNYNATRGRFNNFYQVPFVSNALMLHLDAGNPASYSGSGSTWSDISGNGYNGTLINSPTFSTAGYFTFNGSGHTVSVTKPFPNIVGLISTEIWINFTNYNSTPALIHKGNHFSLRIYNTDKWEWADSSNYSYAAFGSVTATGLQATNTWMQIVCTKDSSNNVRLYKNGSLISTRTPSFGSALTAVNSTLWIGGYSDTDSIPTTSMIAGQIAAVKIYNSTLSDAEVLQNFNSLRGRFSL